MLRLVDQIKSARFFSIVIDETRDISVIEQMCVVVRWVVDDYVIFEYLPGMHQADQCGADSIVTMLKSVLPEVKLIMVLQCYRHIKQVLRRKFCCLTRKHCSLTA